VAAILAIIGYARAYYQDYKIRQEIEALQYEIQSLEKKKIESLEILDYVMSDGFVEERARTDLSMKAPGERVIMFTESSSTAVDATAVTSQKKNLKNPIKWWYYVTNKQID
jgi:cell division protein FtsB